MGERVRLLVVGALMAGLLATVGLGAAPASAQVVPPSPAPAPTAGIGGSVTAGGFPLAQVQVSIVNASNGNYIAQAFTDDSGSYHIDWITAGNYEAFAIAPGNSTEFWFGAGFVDPTIDPPTGITLTTEEPLRNDVSFDFPTGGFSGTITSANATPLFNLDSPCR